MKPIDVKALEKAIRKYLPKELLVENELAQEDHTSVALDNHSKVQQTEAVKPEAEQAEDEKPEASDFENYRIKVHAMKTNLANIGAMTVSDMAKQLELALKKDNNVSYVQENHEQFLKAYEKVTVAVKAYIEKE